MSSAREAEQDERASPFERDLLPARPDGVRNRVYRLLFHHETPAERNFDLALIAAIVVSVIVVLLDSEPAVKMRWHSALVAAEWAFTIVFTIEYALRLWAVRRPLRYATSFFGVIDLLAILPSYLSLLLAGSQYLLVIRVLRLLRIFRVLKLVQYSSEAGVLITALARSRRKIFVFVCTVITIVIIFGAIMYVVEGPQHGFNSIATGMYWAVVTMATVGFGDISPATPLGRFITSILILIGYSIIAVPTGIYTAELAGALRPKRRHVRCSECGLQDHEQEAWHCRRCGHGLPPEEPSA
ncbi:ion transporter [Luteimonas deserti]|uniref:Ion transporter n=1 Tax=Luteimonas deserti TaxID=2752306 RepID=A0A7Z0QR74_9GAMM|nr:ion transporter [Luteimonas deserti]NYZ63371.1 ion transporter [Luteimonas deserti]